MAWSTDLGKIPGTDKSYKPVNPSIFFINGAKYRLTTNNTIKTFIYLFYKYKIPIILKNKHILLQECNRKL